MTNRIHTLLNVSKKEMSRIYLSWSLMFIMRAGFIIGWSAIIAHFLGTVSVTKLPILFFSSAALVIVGTFFYRKLIHIFSKESLIVGSVLIAVTMLIVAGPFAETNPLLFFSLVLVAEAVFLTQAFILIQLFNEELFTPLESQRTFPVIESAETIGGMVGGLLLSLLAHQLPSYKFVLIWALLLLLILPLLLTYSPEKKKSELLAKKPAKKLSFMQQIRFVKGSSFLWGIMLLTFFNWAVINMVEFQYTIALQEELGSSVDIAGRLGLLHVVFNAGALFVQLVLGGRILMELGLVSTMIIHPLVTLFNVIWMMFDFRFMTAAITRGSYETTGLLFKSAQDSSFYAIDDELRGDIKELSAGIMKPLGALMGTGIIFLLSAYLPPEIKALVLNALMCVLVLAMLMIGSYLGGSFTAFCEKNLSKKNDLETRINAIEILSQKGHKKLTESLLKIAKRPDEPHELKVKIIECLGEREEPEAVLGVLELMSMPELALKEAAAKALMNLCKKNFFTKETAFTRYKTIESIQEYLQTDLSEQMKKDLVHAHYFLDSDTLAGYLLRHLDQDKKNVVFIKMLKLFSDPQIKHYLEPYLNSKSPEHKGAAIVALWKHPSLKHQLNHSLKQLLNSPKEAVQAIGQSTLKELESEFGTELYLYREEKL